MKAYPELLKKLLPLHERTQRKILVSEKIDLADFLDYTQRDLNLARAFNSHEFTRGKFDNDIAAIEQVQKTIVELIASTPKKKDSPSYATHAMALNLKRIVIDKKGIGVKDGIDYLKKFSMPPGQSLYNRLNDIINNRIAKPEKLVDGAKKIIDDHKL